MPVAVFTYSYLILSDSELVYSILVYFTISVSCRILHFPVSPDWTLSARLKKIREVSSFRVSSSGVRVTQVSSKFLLSSVQGFSRGSLKIPTFDALTLPLLCSSLVVRKDSPIGCTREEIWRHCVSCCWGFSLFFLFPGLYPNTVRSRLCLRSCGSWVALAFRTEVLDFGQQDLLELVFERINWYPSLLNNTRVVCIILMHT